MTPTPTPRAEGRDTPESGANPPPDPSLPPRIYATAWPGEYQGEWSAGDHGGVEYVRADHVLVRVRSMADFPSDGNEEARWIEHMENACPYCGGSGHKDDVPASPASRPEAPPREEVEGLIERLEGSAYLAAEIAPHQPEPDQTIMVLRASTDREIAATLRALLARNADLEREAATAREKLAEAEGIAQRLAEGAMAGLQHARRDYSYVAGFADGAEAVRGRIAALRAARPRRRGTRAMGDDERMRKVCPHCYWRKPIGTRCGCPGAVMARRAKSFWGRLDLRRALARLRERGETDATD